MLAGVSINNGLPMSLTKFLFKVGHDCHNAGSFFSLKVVAYLAPPSEGQYYHSKHLWARKASKVCPVVSWWVLIPANASNVYRSKSESEEGTQLLTFLPQLRLSRHLQLMFCTDSCQHLPGKAIMPWANWARGSRLYLRHVKSVNLLHTALVVG